MVLIVEDEPISRRAMLRLLRMSGFEAEAVESAEEAIRRIEGGHVPDAVLLDVDLPGMSGIDLARRLRRTNPNVIPMFVTASDDRAEELMVGYPGFYFRKPIDVGRLVQLIHSVPPI